MYFETDWEIKLQTDWEIKLQRRKGKTMLWSEFLLNYTEITWSPGFPPSPGGPGGPGKPCKKVNKMVTNVIKSYVNPDLIKTPRIWM